MFSSSINAPSTRLSTRARVAALVTGVLSIALVVAPLGALPTASASTATVNLGAVSSYSVLGHETVTNTGGTVLEGDLGVYPGTAITGFPPGIALGTTHSADTHSGAAQSALTNAYLDAASRTPDSPAVIGDYQIGGGKTFGPGVYAGASSLGLTGTVILDGGGDPSSVFIFQAGSTLTTASSSLVKLVNGAQAGNVFWVLGSSGTLGTYSTFAGTIMAQASVTVTTGVTVYGRALARTGAVTLDTNHFYTAEADITAPAISITGGDARTTNDSTPAISGTSDAPAGSTITVTVGGQTLTTTVTAAGTWTVTPTALADGVYTVTASTTDAAGNTGTDTQQLTLDSTAPAISITGGDARTTNDSTPTISGTSDAIGGTITVTVGGQTLTTTVTAAGTWTVTPTALADRVYTVTASTTDAAGNTGTDTQQLTLDRTAPAISITGGDARTTNNSTPAISGTSDAPAGSTITVTVGGQTLTTSLTTTPTGARTWMVTPTALADGVYTVTASTTDAAGNTGTDTQQLTLDRAAPAISITGGDTRTTNDSTPTISGTSDAIGGTITVTVGGQTLTATVTDAGTWTVTPAALADGVHPVTASTTDAAGNTGTDTQQLTLDSTAPAISITGGDARTTTDSTPTISGTSDAPAGSTVTVTVGGQTLTATVTDAGTWTVTPAPTDGVYTVTASTTDAAGNIGTDTQRLTLDSTAPAISITGDRTTNDPTPTISGTSNAPAGSTITVTVGGQTLTATVTDAGTWTVTFATLADGDYTVTASTTDAAGNTGTDTQQLTIDSSAPDPAPAPAPAPADNDSTPVNTTDAQTIYTGGHEMIEVDGEQFASFATVEVWAYPITTEVTAAQSADTTGVLLDMRVVKGERFARFATVEMSHAFTTRMATQSAGPTGVLLETYTADRNGRLSTTVRDPGLPVGTYRIVLKNTSSQQFQPISILTILETQSLAAVPNADLAATGSSLAPIGIALLLITAGLLALLAAKVFVSRRNSRRLV